MMMHAFLGVTQEMAEELPAYLRVLGANERGREILSVMAGTASLPVSASLAELERSRPCSGRTGPAGGAFHRPLSGDSAVPGPLRDGLHCTGDLECMKCFTLLRKNQ